MTRSLPHELPPVITPTPQTADDIRRQALGVDLSRYANVLDRPEFDAIPAFQNRGIAGPILRSIGYRLVSHIPDPVMLTHIVTTRCNYSCGFCSFADSLNARHNELSVEEITPVYQTIGQNLNTIVYSGGETTLHPQLPEIIEAAYRYTPVKSVYIISNAWKPDLLFAITHQIMQRCPELHLTWSLSIEGPKAINNQARHTRSEHWDAWQNTIDTAEGLKRMRQVFDYDQLDVQLCTVCAPSNEHILDEWYETVRDVIRPDKWNLNLMRKSVQMSGSELAGFDERRATGRLAPFEETYQRITGRVRQDVLNGRLKFAYHTGSPMEGAMKSAVDLISQAENRRTLNNQFNTLCCGAGFHGAYISSTGLVSGCEEFAHNPTDEKSYGDLREAAYNFQALWHSSTAQKHRKQTGKAPECRGCTLESQRNYPAALVSPITLGRAVALAGPIQRAAGPE
ncbi:MAG: radical SAM protein [Candidatus Melainabacteria bacterium]